MSKLLKSKLVNLIVIITITIIFIIIAYITDVKTSLNTNSTNESIDNSITVNDNNINVNDDSISANSSFNNVLDDENNDKRDLLQTDNNDDTLDNEVINEEKIEQTNEEYIEYIVDVLYITDDIISGDTASIEGYSGKILIDVNSLSNKNEIYTNTTYYVKAETLIEMGTLPKIKAISMTKASDEQLNELDEYRRKVSNYAECKLNYESMGINEIIEDANKNYVYWTQEERNEFISFINSIDNKDDITSLLKIYTYKQNVNINDNTVME